MDYKELIEQLRAHEKNCGYGGYCILCKCLSAIETLLAERDALMAQVRGECGKCVNLDIPVDVQPCCDCRYGIFALEPGSDHWQWRGPQKEGGSGG